MLSIGIISQVSTTNLYASSPATIPSRIAAVQSAYNQYMTAYNNLYAYAISSGSPYKQNILYALLSAKTVLDEVNNSTAINQYNTSNINQIILTNALTLFKASLIPALNNVVLYSSNASYQKSAKSGNSNASAAGAELLTLGQALLTQLEGLSTQLPPQDPTQLPASAISSSCCTALLNQLNIDALNTGTHQYTAPTSCNSITYTQLLTDWTNFYGTPYPQRDNLGSISVSAGCPLVVKIPDSDTYQCMAIIKSQVVDNGGSDYGLNQLIYSVQNNLCCANINKTAALGFDHEAVCYNLATQQKNTSYNGKSPFINYPTIVFSVFDAINTNDTGISAGIENLSNGRTCPAGIDC